MPKLSQTFRIIYLKKTDLRFCILLFLLGLCNNSHSQNTEPAIDSLKKELKKATQDSLRCRILYNMVETDNDETAWPIYNEELLSIAEAQVKAQKDGTHEHELFTKYLALAYNNKGFANVNKSNVKEAFDYFNKGLKLQQGINDRSGMITTYLNLGSVFNRLGQIKEALDYFGRSLRMAEEQHDVISIAYSLNNIGSIYELQKQPSEALVYYTKCLKILESTKDDEAIGRSHINIGIIHMTLGELEIARDHFEKSLKILKASGSRDGTASALTNLGTVWRKMKQPEKALEYYLQGLKIREVLNEKQGTAVSLNKIGLAYFDKNELSEALKFELKSLALAKEIGFPDNIQDAAIALKDIYKKQNNYKEAFVMYELEIQMRDSTINRENNKLLIKKQYQYEYEKKAATDSLKVADEKRIAAAELQQEKTRSYALYGGLALVVLFSLFIGNRLRVISQQKKVIEDQKELVETQKQIVEEKQKEVMASIYYARKIQTALITSEKYIEKTLLKLKKD
jgi:tetratricopeptide (TPR) repeat protein